MTTDPYAWLFATHDMIEAEASDAERWPLTPAEEAELARFEKRLDEKKAIEAQRAAAEAELKLIDRALDDIEGGDNSTESELELAAAQHVVAHAAWRERNGHLWPWVYAPETFAEGLIYPAGTRERLHGERLKKRIDRLTVLREAELVIEIHNLRSAA